MLPWLPFIQNIQSTNFHPGPLSGVASGRALRWCRLPHHNGFRSQKQKVRKVSKFVVVTFFDYFKTIPKISTTKRPKHNLFNTFPKNNYANPNIPPSLSPNFSHQKVTSNSHMCWYCSCPTL